MELGKGRERVWVIMYVHYWDSLLGCFPFVLFLDFFFPLHYSNTELWQWIGDTIQEQSLFHLRHIKETLPVFEKQIWIAN